MKDSITHIQREMSSGTQRIINGQKQVQCPDASKMSGCVSPMLFIALVVIQLIIIIGYQMYRYVHTIYSYAKLVNPKSLAADQLPS